MKISLSSLKSKEYLEQKEKDLDWAIKIKAFDNNCCVICNSPFHPNAHHIIPREIKSCRHELDNGITLCTKHHKFSRVLSAHNNPLAFYMWLEKYKKEKIEKAKERTKALLLSEQIVV